MQKPTENSEHSDAELAAPLERTIALVGMMGVGKSTVGRRLAETLGAQFVDSDDEIEAAAGKSVADIFAEHGEAEFRRGERRVIERLVGGEPIVLATGGGAYLDAETRALLAKVATTVWLRADIETLWKRVSKRTTRPLLQQPNPRQILEDLNAARAPVYAEADFTIESGEGPAKQVVDEIRTTLGLG